MVVVSNIRMQDVFRNGFKRAGYRVLLTSDPHRALSRFQQEPGTADCVVFNAQELGKTALRGFNEFADDSRTEAVPAILLLDEEQSGWKEEAALADHRLVLPMPITMKQLRAALGKLVPGSAGRAGSA
jgi:serine/threonine-protein kinase